MWSRSSQYHRFVVHVNIHLIFSSYIEMHIHKSEYHTKILLYQQCLGICENFSTNHLAENDRNSKDGGKKLIGVG